MRTQRAGRRRPAHSALVVAVALLGIAGCSSGTELAVGEVDATDAPAADGVDGHRVSVTVPTGRLDIVVAEPREEIGDQRAADDGSLIRLTTSFRDAEVRTDVWAFAAREGNAEPVTLALEVGDERYDVGVVRRGADQDNELAPDDAVVAVPDGVRLDDVRLLVGYDGLEQAASAADGTREPGPADALYDGAERGPSANCARGRFEPRVDPEFRCRVGEARLLPYLPGPGWAEEGRGWLVVSLGTELTEVRAGDARYEVGSVANRTTYQGESAAATFDERHDSVTYSAQLAFDVANGEAADRQGLRVALDYRLSLTAGDPPAGGGPDRLRYVDDVTVPDPTPSQS